MIGRMLLVRGVLRETFGYTWRPLLIGGVFLSLRVFLAVAMALDTVLSPTLRATRIRAPIVIVGNPRTGTTFLQRFLTDNEFGAGMQLFRMVYSSLIVQRLLRPFVPFMEAVSPARHHKSAAHETDLLSIETDDVSMLFRFFDGFFLYGFFLAHAETDHVKFFDPAVRDTSARDFAWLEALWRRSLAYTGRKRVVAKLFSTGVRMQAFLDRFPDAKILYMARDPVAVIPSTMSLVTGVLDSALGFWSLPEVNRRRYLDRLYLALIDLLRRFHTDWTAGNIARDRVYVVRYDRLMADFDSVMAEICSFIGSEPTPAQSNAIARVAASQRAYRSEHVYDLAKFGLDADRIRRDTAFYTETFLS